MGGARPTCTSAGLPYPATDHTPLPSPLTSHNPQGTSLHNLITHHTPPITLLPPSAEVVSDLCSKCQIYVTHFTSEDCLHEELCGGDDVTGCCHWLPAWLCLHSAAGPSPPTGHHLGQEGGPASQTPSKVVSLATIAPSLSRLCGAGSLYTVWTCGVRPYPPSSPLPPSPPSSTP